MGDIGTAKNGVDRYQRVIVAYFNLDAPGRLTRDDLRTWGANARGVPKAEQNLEGELTGETSDTSLTLPDDFTYFDSAGVSWVDGATTVRYSDTPIPAFTQGASGQIEFYLKAERASAVEVASASGGTVSDPMSGITGSRFHPLFFVRQLRTRFCQYAVENVLRERLRLQFDSSRLVKVNIDAVVSVAR